MPKFGYCIRCRLYFPIGEDKKLPSHHSKSGKICRGTGQVVSKFRFQIDSVDQAVQIAEEFLQMTRDSRYPLPDEESHEWLPSAQALADFIYRTHM